MIGIVLSVMLKANVLCMLLYEEEDVRVLV